MDPDPMDIAVAVIVAAVPLVVIIGGLIIGALAVRSQARIKTLTHQERLAMIERGLTPPPTASLFDTIGIPGPAGGSVDDLIKLKAAKQRLKDDPTHRRDSAVWMLGFGSAAALLFWVGFDEPELAIGFGGALGILGLTFFVSSFVARPESAASSPGPAPGPSEPAGTDDSDSNT